MVGRLAKALRVQQSGLLLVILAFSAALTAVAPRYVDRATGQPVNAFFNPSTLMQVATDASFIAIMAVGLTAVIVSGGIDLSVGSIYALAGVFTALAMKALGPLPAAQSVALGLALCLGFGLACGLLNGLMVAGLGVHPFVITLGTMWVYRGLAFVASRAESVLVPRALTEFVKNELGLAEGLHPVPLILTLGVVAAGWVFLFRTVAGRRVFAIGGNREASLYSGLPIGRVLVGVYAISGLCAGLAAFVGASYYGAVSSNDATGYELYVVAAAVVGGASLSGGKGSAVGAALGALLIVLIRQSIRTLRLDQSYEWIIVGVAIIAAVVLDRLSARLSRAAGPSK